MYSRLAVSITRGQKLDLEIQCVCLTIYLKKTPQLSTSPGPDRSQPIHTTLGLSPQIRLIACYRMQPLLSKLYALLFLFHFECKKSFLHVIIYLIFVNTGYTNTLLFFFFIVKCNTFFSNLHPLLQ